MLFNSYYFILVFLPTTLCVFYFLGEKGRIEAAKMWLVLASLFFYGWWNPPYLVLIAGSILFNYKAGSYFSAKRSEASNKATVVFAVAANLAALGYFKYANFFIDSVNGLFSSDIFFNRIILPLGISFFTFQQISYIVDSYRSKSAPRGFLNYVLFVAFFPKLFAGPIVRRDEMIPTLDDPQNFRFSQEKFAVGFTIFAVGLFKKVGLADTIASVSDTVFNAAQRGVMPTFFEAWGGALAYSLQLYFDFSGYSDMAVGLGLLFGIKMPLNFNSPYKSKGIAQFWRTWHMTLSRFLRDYIYIPLGGNRKGRVRQYCNLMTTMLLGGLWHGAGWNFVIWGGLHGFYLAVQHAIEGIFIKKRNFSKLALTISGPLVWALTFLSVTIAWVFFRAADFHSAISMLKAMSGLEGLYAPETVGGKLIPWKFISPRIFEEGGQYKIAALFLIATILPNVQQIMRKFEPLLDMRDVRPSFIEWTPSRLWAVSVGIVFLVAVLKINKYSGFLYFQF